ncbi:hypothetical protein [Streptomyces sp. NPDC002845]
MARPPVTGLYHSTAGRNGLRDGQVRRLGAAELLGGELLYARTELLTLPYGARWAAPYWTTASATN